MSDRAPRELAQWRQGVLFAVLSAAFVSLRFAMNVEYEGAPWHELIAGTAKLPFGHRVLVPQLARPWLAWGCSAEQVFGVTEWLSVMATLFGVRALARQWLSRWAAVWAAAGVLPVLCLLFLLPFRWPVFYPWDLPAIAMTVWAMVWTKRRRHGALLVLCVVAALNRESAVLIPAMVAISQLESRKHRPDALRWAALLMVVVIVVRFAIGVVWSQNPGAALHWHVSEQWRVLHNLRWLQDPAQALQVLGALSGLPVLWVVLRARLPAELRRLEWVLLASLGGLLWVANIYEPRAFGEPVAMAYAGVVVALGRGEDDGERDGRNERATPPGWLARLDRWAPPAIVVAFVASVIVLAR